MRMTPRTTVAATATMLALGGLAAPSAAANNRLPSECSKGTMSATVSIKNATKTTYHFAAAEPGPLTFMTFPQPREMAPGATVNYLACTTSPSAARLDSIAFWSTTPKGDFALSSLVNLTPGKPLEIGLADLFQHKEVGTLDPSSITKGKHLQLKWTLTGC